MKLVALVGINVGDRRFEPGDRIEADLTDRQERHMLSEGWAEAVEPGQRLPPEHKEAIVAGAGDPNPLAPGEVDADGRPAR